MKSLAKAIFANEELRKHVLMKFLDLINENFVEKNSPFRKIAIDKLPEFTWDKLADDLKLKAPTIFKIFSLVVSHSDHRNEFKKMSHAEHMYGYCYFIEGTKQRNVWGSVTHFHCTICISGPEKSK